MRPLSVAARLALTAAPCPAADLPRSTPEWQGVSAAVRHFVRHGHGVAEGDDREFHPGAAAW